MRLGGCVFYEGTHPEEYALAYVKKRVSCSGGSTEI